MNSEAENGVSADNPALEPLEPTEAGPSQPISGDTIGKTGYSKRFVLKTLGKLANLDTLQQTVSEPSFEDELCTLWKFTSDKDFVLYLKAHDALNLFTSAISVIKTSRIIEIIIGTIANMCCHTEIVHALLANQNYLDSLLEFLNLDDDHVLIQVLRLVKFCLHDAEEGEISIWLHLFKRFKYDKLIYFVLNNSANKELLIIAIESLHTVCSTCHTNECESEYFELFVNVDALRAVYIAYCEYSNLATPDDKLERLHIVTLQLVMHLSEFTNANEPSYQFVSSVTNALDLLQQILESYISKIKYYHKMDFDFLDVLDAVTEFIQYLEASNVVMSPTDYFTASYYMWKALLTPRERDRDNEAMMQFIDDIKESFATIMCNFMANCKDLDLIEVLDYIGNDYENIVSQSMDVEIQAVIEDRVSIYGHQLIQNVF